MCIYWYYVDFRIICLTAVHSGIEHIIIFPTQVRSIMNSKDIPNELSIFLNELRAFLF